MWKVLFLVFSIVMCCFYIYIYKGRRKKEFLNILRGEKVQGVRYNMVCCRRCWYNLDFYGFIWKFLVMKYLVGSWWYVFK